MFLDSFKSFLAEPFKPSADMDALDWFLAIGLVLIILMIWTVIFKHIEG